MLAVGSQAEAVAMALIRWYFQWAGAMGRVISARWLSLPQRKSFNQSINRKQKLRQLAESASLLVSMIALVKIIIDIQRSSVSSSIGR